MLKSKFCILYLSSILAVVCWGLSAEAQYVRKKQQPSFFIPHGEMEYKPKQAPLVRYRQGEGQTVSHKERMIEKSVTKPMPTNAAPQQHEDTLNTYAEEQNVSDEAKVPEYQQVYQNYLKDVDKVAKGRKMPANPKLKADLSKMNSNERIKVDKEFNATRDVIGDFRNALN